jgi:hypothetical protein
MVICGLNQFFPVGWASFQVRIGQMNKAVGIYLPGEINYPRGALFEKSGEVFLFVKGSGIIRERGVFLFPKGLEIY